jgi:hypothetical protein
MNYWIFQGNPDIFNLNTYIKNNLKITWSVRQKHFASYMYPGDEVFIWRSAGRANEISGIVAYGYIVSRPKEMADDLATQGLWTLGDPALIELRVLINLANTCISTKNIVRREWLKNDPITAELMILKQAAGTNYRINRQQADRLKSLVINTGRDWTREECIAGLWAYAKTRTGSVSKSTGSTIATVALQIGRAVTGVYNKVMNYRALDTSDPRKGLDRGSHLDQQVWNEFFDSKTNGLDVEHLNKVKAEYWNVYSETPTAKTTYVSFGDAPNDDPYELAQFAAKIRRGQPIFRKNLLIAYGEKCAISGFGPADVLDAVHVVSHAETGINELHNGLLLRSDLHCLYDARLLSIHPKTKCVVLDEVLKDTPYWEFNGKLLRARVDGSQIEEKYLLIRWQKNLKKT